MWCILCISCIYRENTARLTGTVQISSCSFRASGVFWVIALSSVLCRAFGAFGPFLVKTIRFSYYTVKIALVHLVHLIFFELSSDMSGTFGVFGAFFVKTIRFNLYFTDCTHALLVHPFLVKTIKIHLQCGDCTHAAILHPVHSRFSGQIAHLSGAFGAFDAFLVSKKKMVIC